MESMLGRFLNLPGVSETNDVVSLGPNSEQKTKRFV
jgi:hypothetical protein